MRTVTVYSEAAIYRARVIPSTKGIFNKRDGWRYVIEYCWSQIPSDMRRPEDWKVHHEGPWTPDEEDARQGAEEWLDRAEQRNPSTDDYV